MRFSTGIARVGRCVGCAGRLLPILVFVVLTASGETRTAVARASADSKARTRDVTTSVASDTRERATPMTAEIMLTEPPLQSSIGGDQLDDFEARAATPYEAVRQLAMNGEWEQAEALVKTALASDPNNGDLHRVYAEIAYYNYKDLGRLDALDVVAAHALRAFELALQNSSLDFRAADLLADSAAAVKTPEVLDALFAKAAVFDNSGRLEVARAQALAALGSPNAEEEFRRAASLASVGNTHAVELYAEWLLDAGRTIDALNLLERYEQLATNPYRHFLRGVALDRSGNSAQAATEYEMYASFSAVYPAPARFRLAGSAVQASAGIHFRDEQAPRASTFPMSVQQVGRAVTTALTTSQAQQGLSYLIYGEAGGESMGGKRAEGWVVRNRVLRGNVYNDAAKACPVVENGGTTLGDKYKAVMCQGNGSQFNGMCLYWCSNPSTTSCKDPGADSKAAAVDVYNGNAPDPVGAHCPSGFSSYGAFCDTGTRCVGDTSSFRLAGGLFNYAKASGLACPTLCPGVGVGKTCGNGGSDNCFYPNTRYALTGYYGPYTATFTATGQTGYSDAFSARAGTQKAHMEGTENSLNPDFDLYLEKSCGTNCWTTVASSTRLGTVEDLSYDSSTTASYRWRIKSFKGTGSLQLYTVRP